MRVHSRLIRTGIERAVSRVKHLAQTLTAALTRRVA